MNFLNTIELFPILDSIFSLFVAFVMGTIIGAERQYRQRSAGLRTNALVAIGAAAFTDLGQRLGGNMEAIRIIANVVTGVGFLGAGVIMKEGTNIRGLNTAATLWCSAAVGACAGSDMIVEAVIVTVFVLLANISLHGLVEKINRTPLDTRIGEARFEVHLMVDSDALAACRRLLLERLNMARYPVRDVDIIDRGEAVTEVVATLSSTAAVGSELDSITAQLKHDSGVKNAFWEMAAIE